MICWSSRSRTSRNRPSDPSAIGHAATALSMRRPPFIELTALNGITRSPDLVRTINTAMRARSSWGATASSRTRPHWPPAGSNTGRPSNSVSASEGIALREYPTARQEARRVYRFFWLAVSNARWAWFRSPEIDVYNPRVDISIGAGQTTKFADWGASLARASRRRGVGQPRLADVSGLRAGSQTLCHGRTPGLLY